MTIITIAVLGLISVLLAVQLKQVKGEYGVYLAAACGLLILFYGVERLEVILKAVEKIQSYIKIDQTYLTALMKMIGITYIVEFASGICKDAGYGAIGSQIEVFGKLSILAVSMPILLALMETLQSFLQ